jgi:hypothetical protein
LYSSNCIDRALFDGASGEWFMVDSYSSKRVGKFNATMIVLIVLLNLFLLSRIRSSFGYRTRYLGHFMMQGDDSSSILISYLTCTFPTCCFVRPCKAKTEFEVFESTIHQISSDHKSGFVLFHSLCIACSALSMDSFACNSSCMHFLVKPNHAFPSHSQVLMIDE